MGYRSKYHRYSAFLTVLGESCPKLIILSAAALQNVYVVSWALMCPCTRKATCIHLRPYIRNTSLGHSALKTFALDSSPTLDLLRPNAFPGHKAGHFGGERATHAAHAKTQARTLKCDDALVAFKTDGHLTREHM
jgi:hypothetical protein